MNGNVVLLWDVEDAVQLRLQAALAHAQFHVHMVNGDPTRALEETNARLVMLDPVILDRWAVAMFQLPLLRGLPRRMAITKGALRRRQEFDSPQQALESWRGRGAFRGWSEMITGSAAFNRSVASGVPRAVDRVTEPGRSRLRPTGYEGLD